MKATRIVRAIAVAAAGALGVAGLVAPAEAATRSLVVIHESNALTSFNSGTPETNLVTNSDVAYMTGAGFAYYDDNRNLIRNTTFGTFGLVKKSGCAQAVKYTVKPGRVWSDGTPIDGVDLLLSHVLASSQFSKDAGLGDPADTTKLPAFNSFYGGPYDNHVKGVPALSSDKMSVTVCYDAFQPDWQIMGPGPAPVHTLVQMANGKSSAQSLAQNKLDKAAFLAAIKAKDTDLLKKIGDVWSNDYNIQTVNGSTNELLFVGNGGFMVKSAVKDASVTLVQNPKYNSGPKLSGKVKTVVFKFIGDSTAAAQALANKELDIYAGQPTSDAVAALEALKGVKVKGGVSACFEHLDLRIGTGTEGETYSGPWAGMSAKSKALRKAFLLAYPREDIVGALVQPVNENAVVVNSSFLLPGQTGYNTVAAYTKSVYASGTQDKRTASALALVKKYFPKAKAGSKSVKINILWGQPSNTRRANEFQLAKAELAKAGFDLTNAGGTAGWSGFLGDNSYDAAFFAWCPSTVSQTGTNANFQSDGGNNFIGYKSAAMDKLTKKLETNLTDAEVISTIKAAEKLLADDAVSLPIFQHPAVTAYNSALKGVKPAPLTPNIVWNYWEWSY
ncbi:MAG: ABC transporter substrate-binding protein [Microbacteriaceae bacterium]